MQQVDVTNSAATLSTLIDQVQGGGGEILLMREGKPVARLVPEPLEGHPASELTPEQQARAKRGIASLRALAKELRLGPFDLQEFKQDRDEGRR